MTDPREPLITGLDRARHGFGGVGSDAVHLRSPTCGDEVRIEAEVSGGVITGVRWTGHGCTVSMASASALATVIPGSAVDGFDPLHAEFTGVVRGTVLDPFAVDDERLGDAVAFAGIGRLPLRAGCADLAWQALSLVLERDAGIGG